MAKLRPLKLVSRNLLSAKKDPRKIRVIQTARRIKNLIRVLFHPATRNWSKTSTQSTQTQQCLLKRGNKMTLIFPAPGIWCGEMNLQTQPAPGNWSEVRTSNSEGRSYTSTICRSPTISTSKKSSRTCGKSWISQKEHQQWVLKLWRPTYWYGDYLCRQRWKPPFILDQISLNIWMYTETRTSKNCRICTISLRSWYLTITQRFWMWHRFIGQLHHGRELHLRMIKWSRWRTQKYASTQFPSNVWENARSLRSESMMGKSSTIISTVQFLQRITRNWWRTNWVRLEYFPRTYVIADSPEDPDRRARLTHWTWRLCRSNHFQVIDWTKRGNSEQCISNSEKVKKYAKRFSRGHWTFLGAGGEKKWYGTHRYTPGG